MAGRLAHGCGAPQVEVKLITRDQAAGSQGRCKIDDSAGFSKLKRTIFPKSIIGRKFLESPFF
jgi:hypothetical protein